MLLRETIPIAGVEASNRLVVFVHGWGGRLFSTRDVEETIRAEMKEADLMVPKYRSHIAANTNPIEIAEALAKAIEQAVENRQRAGGRYEDILLVGFSLGSLIVRKAYVFARGQVQDSLTPALRPRFQWPEQVSRIILLGGVNRGWSMSPKPRHLMWTVWLMYHLLYPLTTLLPAGRLIRAFRRGMPFVANLRIQWQNLENQAEPLPTTIQLLGKHEDVVSLEDNIDIQFCKRFVFLSVPETGHFNAMNFHQKLIGPQRRQIFVRALRQQDLQGDYLGTPSLDTKTERVVGGGDDEYVSDVVFVIHGIRDFGQWTHKVRDCIERVATAEQRKVFVNTTAYTRFPMSGFLLSLFRHAKTRWFMDQYSQVFARYPLARFHFIGHSNGTYLLASALRHYAACQFDRVAFAGSVVPRDFPWDDVASEQRVLSLRNDLAAEDWVVAVFPRFFEQLREVLGLPVGDLGSAGVFGFQDAFANQNQVAYLKGGHGAGIVPANHASLARYVLAVDDTPRIDDGVTVVNNIAPWVARCSAMCGFIWALLALMPLATSVALTYLWYGLASGTWQLSGLLPWLASSSWIPAVTPFALVLLLLAWILSTV